MYSSYALAESDTCVNSPTPSHSGRSFAGVSRMRSSTELNTVPSEW